MTKLFWEVIVDMNTTTRRGADQGASKLNAVISKLRKNLTNLGMNQRAINTKINELRSSSSLNKTAYANNIFKKAKAAKARSNAAKAVKAVKAPINTNNKKRNISINRKCDADGSKMYYRISDISNVTANKTNTSKTKFEAKFLIDTLKAIRGQCFTVHQQCKGLYPVVTGREEGREWLTSIDQDNDISLQHTLDKSDIPILYNTPRMCDPGLSKSKNWSLKNYIQTRLFMYNNIYKKGKTLKNRNSNCFKSVVFDFRPFTYSMEYEGKKIYITQWMELKPESAYGFEPHIAISDTEINKTINTRDFFTRLAVNYSRKKYDASPVEFNNSNPLRLSNDEDVRNFIKFINDYEGVGFAGVSNSNGNLPILNIKGIPNIKIEDDILRMFYFDLLHDLSKESKSFKNTTFAMFSLNFINELRSLSGTHEISQWAGAGTTSKSYDKYGTTIVKKTRNSGPVNKVEELPAIFKTIGDLSQYIYAAKYNTTVASGDRMGIAVGLYVCAKMGKPVKCMIEDGITGFVLYTGRNSIKFTSKSSCKGGNRSGSGACFRNTNTVINATSIENRVRQFNPTIAKQMDIIEAKKPKLPPNMKTLVQLWSTSATLLNSNSIDGIMKIINDFQGYWSNTDLKRFIQIIQSLTNRQNINNSRRTKLAALSGQLRAYLKENTPKNNSLSKPNRPRNNNFPQSKRLKNNYSYKPNGSK